MMIKANILVLTEICDTQILTCDNLLKANIYPFN